MKHSLIIFLTYLRGGLHWLWIVAVFSGAFITIIFLLAIKARRTADKLERVGAFLILWFCGIKVQAKDKQNIPAPPFLLLFNHASYIDILSLFQVTPQKLHFGAKKILQFIPLLGWTMWLWRHIPIDRKNPRATYHTYLSLAKRIQQGDCFALAPEGTRQTTQILGPFKKGPFIFAINYQIPILPVVIHGAKEGLPKGSWFFNIGAWERSVLIEYLPPISTQGLNKSHVPKLQKQVKELILQRLLM